MLWVATSQIKPDLSFETCISKYPKVTMLFEAIEDLSKLKDTLHLRLKLPVWMIPENSVFLYILILLIIV